jgi:hypothetical protein
MAIGALKGKVHAEERRRDRLKQTPRSETDPPARTLKCLSGAEYGAGSPRLVRAFGEPFAGF